MLGEMSLNVEMQMETHVTGWNLRWNMTCLWVQWLELKNKLRGKIVYKQCLEVSMMTKKTNNDWALNKGKHIKRGKKSNN